MDTIFTFCPFLCHTCQRYKFYIWHTTDMHRCTNTCVHMCRDTSTHRYTYTHAHKYTQVHMQKYRHMHICFHVHKCTYIYTYKHTCTYIHTYIHFKQNCYFITSNLLFSQNQQKSLLQQEI